MIIIRKKLSDKYTGTMRDIWSVFAFHIGCEPDLEAVISFLKMKKKLVRVFTLSK